MFSLGGKRSPLSLPSLISMAGHHQWEAEALSCLYGHHSHWREHDEWKRWWAAGRWCLAQASRGEAAQDPQAIQIPGSADQVGLEKEEQEEVGMKDGLVEVGSEKVLWASIQLSCCFQQVGIVRGAQ